MNNYFLFFCGIIARVINFFVPIKEKCWIMGADNGKSYREGPKYLLEYMLQHHPDYNCCYITMSKDVYDSLKVQGIPCELNYSISGMIKLASAECIFTAMSVYDIRLYYKKKKRRVFYMGHGMPLKIAFFLLEKDPNYYNKIGISKGNLLNRFNKQLGKYFIDSYELKDSDFFPATSEFTKWCNDVVFCNLIDVRVLGYPRNDALFQPKRMSKEKWVKGVEGKFVVTYMPTHRLYGRGEASPTPFENRPDVQEWMKENNVVLLVKNHPNMEAKVKNPYQSECIMDITSSGIDPQVALFYSDVLVTDYSSVWTDYLLLRRPVIFYIYDDFEENDTGSLYDIREDPPGHFCYTENEFFDLLKQCIENVESMKPSNDIVAKFHKYVDGKSCERYYNEIVKK